MSSSAKRNKKEKQLIVASYEGDIKRVQKLISEGVNISFVDEYKNNALLDAFHRDHYEICHLLIDNGADVNFVGQHNMTALHYASIAGPIELVEKLVEKGANVNSLNKNKQTPLLHLLYLVARDALNSDIEDILLERSRKVHKILAQAGIDLSIKDEYGNSYYDYAIRAGLYKKENLVRVIEPGTKM